MFTDSDKERLRDGSLSTQLWIHYLQIYVGNANWEQHVGTLWKRLQKRGDGAPKLMKQALACAILLPAKDRSTYIDPENAENLLFKVMSYRQFEERDWFEDLRKIVAEDINIEEFRRKALSLGVIDPFDFAPNTRQAYNWLYIRAEESGAITPETKEDVSKRFKNLVLAYGGAVICNIFTRHDDHLKKVINWRSGYFFERVIFDVYKPEQVMKIKKAELDQTSERLVKRIKVEAS